MMATRGKSESSGNGTGGRRLPSRDRVVTMRRLEREDGVPFWCHRTGFEARVKLLSLADQTMLAGIPSELQEQLSETLTAQAQRRGRSFGDLLATVSEDERLANGFCMQGFVAPRLVATEADLDGSDDCWLVTDLHIDERKKYLNLVLGAEKEEMAKIASFLHEGLAGAAAG
jgi:hypothetical protein